MNKVFAILTILLLLGGAVLIMTLTRTDSAPTQPNTDSPYAEGSVREDSPFPTAEELRTTTPTREAEQPVAAEPIILTDEQVEELTMFASPIGGGNYGEYELYQNGTILIQYDNYEQRFVVVLKSGNLYQGREQAEQWLMSQLGLTRQELCGLNVQVSMRPQAGQPYRPDVGLSACPRL